MTLGTRRRLRVPADLDRLADVRTLVRGVADACDAPVVCIDDLVQAVDEAATNVIVHGYGGRPGWLTVAAELVGDKIVITLEDEAPTMDPTLVPEPDLTVPPQHRRPGGMGVHIMRIATDELRHSPRPGGGNILTLARRLDPRPKEDRQMSLETTIEQVEGHVPITVLALDGELDASNFEELIDTVRRLYDGGTRRLLVDLRDLRFMASSGLVALHSIVRIMHGEPPPDPEAGWSALHADVGPGQTEVQLCSPQAAVERVLSRTGLDRLFVVHPDRDAAIAAV